MTAETIGAIVTCAIAVGGILIYLGRSLNTLSTIDKNQELLFTRSYAHEKDIARIDKEVTEVKTRQEDCSNCP